jgi:hypothetical protein
VTQIPQESREQGIALIEQVIDRLSSISARAMSGDVPDDPSDIYTACGEMQVTLQEAILLLQAYPTRTL